MNTNKGNPNNRSIREKSENPIVYLSKDPIENPIVDRNKDPTENPILVGATQHKETETHDRNRRNPNVRQPTAKGTNPSKHCRQLEEENANLRNMLANERRQKEIEQDKRADMKAEIKRITELSQIERQKREDEMYLAETMNIEIKDLKRKYRVVMEENQELEQRTKTLETLIDRSGTVCRHFMRGNCRYGNECWKIHPTGGERYPNERPQSPNNYGVSRDRQDTDPSRRRQRELRDHRQTSTYYHKQQSISRDMSPYRPENKRQPTKHNEESQDKHRLQTLINNISDTVRKYLQGARK